MATTKGRTTGIGLSVQSLPKTGGLAAKIAAATTQPAPHLIVEARAGSGKTTTLVEGLKVVRGLTPSITPSDQQRAIWDSLALSAGARSVGFLAFNKSIATELQKRVPAGCDAMTLHSLGFAAVRAHARGVRINEYRVSDVVARLLDSDPRTLRQQNPGLLPAVTRLVSLAKTGLLGVAGPVPDWADAVSELAADHGIELEDVKDHERVYDLVPRVLDACRDLSSATTEGIDFDDMVWLPVALDLPLKKYDLLMVDESQDLNRCGQAIVKAAGRRLVLCGDPRQAIYGFAGADSRSMARMAGELASTPAGCVTLPLTVTRRCGKAIVAEANKLVKDFYAHEANPPGEVGRMLMAPRGGTVTPALDYFLHARPGDMVLCRTNAPLVSECFRFLKTGVKANIQGRDVGQGLISTVTRLKADSVPDLVGKLDDWLHREVEKEQRRRNPSEARVQALHDRADCIRAFAAGATGVTDVIRKIESVFTNDPHATGVRLSSIHKAKGLEADRVFLLQPKGAEVVPHWLAGKPEWEQDQARNLLYVAVTRAVRSLYHVSSPS